MATFSSGIQKRMTEKFCHLETVPLTDLIETLHGFSVDCSKLFLKSPSLADSYERNFAPQKS